MGYYSIQYFTGSLESMRFAYGAVVAFATQLLPILFKSINIAPPSHILWLEVIAHLKVKQQKHTTQTSRFAKIWQTFL